MNRKTIILSLTVLLLLLSINLFGIDVTIGTGDQLNRKPFDFYYRFSLFETLYYPHEINTAGYIEAISIYNSFLNPVSSNGRVQFWLGTTDMPDLTSGWIPSTQLTMVFNSSVTFPSGQNVIRLNLNTPFLYRGGNLVLLARTPGNSGTTVRQVSFRCQTIGTNRARDYYSNTTNADHENPPLTGTHLNLSGQFPMTTLHFRDEPPTIDLGILNFSGPTVMTLGQPYTHTVTVQNYGTSVQSNYTVNLYNWNNEVISTVTGTQLAPSGQVDIPITWTPEGSAGYSTIYAKVILNTDQNMFNNSSQILDIMLLDDDGGIILPPDPVQVLVPLDMSKNNSLFQTIFPSDYLISQNLNDNRLITRLKFYNNFTQNIPGKPVKIWLGTTSQTNLTSGWIPSTQLTAVFDGNLDFPSGSNAIEIVLQNPFFYSGGNLVLMVNRPFDNSTYSNTNTFNCYVGNADISRNIAGNSEVYNPANPPLGTASLTNLYPATSFVYSYENLSTLKGMVSNGQNQPITNATLQLLPSGKTVTTDSSGKYEFSWLEPGAYQLSVNAPGYYGQQEYVTIASGQLTIQNFRLYSTSNYFITGRVVSFINPSYGIADATVEISGSYTTAAGTNASGYFTIYDIPANSNFTLRASHPLYFTYYGSANVVNANIDLGDIPLEIDTTPVDNHTAVVATAISACYPNPFRVNTSIFYEVKEPAQTSIEIFNIKGQKVNTLVNAYSKAGSYSTVWDATDYNGRSVSNAVYYYKMTSGTYTSTKKVVLLR